MDRTAPPGSPAIPAAGRIELAGHVLDLGRGELFTADGTPAALRHKALKLLLVLGERCGEVVSKDELMRRVWPQVVVTDDSLTQAVAEIRRVLADKKHEWLRTRARRGYMLVAKTEAASQNGSWSVAAVGMLAATAGIPASDGRLVGRTEDLATLCALVVEGGLVTLVGAGGIGKTRLAQAAAHVLASRFEQGVCWVDLAPAGDPARVLPIVAAAAGVELAGVDPLKSLAAALVRRHMLVVLDNCEHMADATASVAIALRDGAPAVHLLATSQAPLKLRGEQVVRLGPLALPPPDSTLEVARACGAFELLEQRARKADHLFVFDQAVLAQAVDICRRLDGLALALEMAAARLPALGVSGVHAMLCARLGAVDALKSERRDGEHRHASLQATLQWSCSLLGAAERAALHALAVFAGPFDAEMARALVVGESADELLVSLVDKSLVQVERREPPRYRLLDSMRSFALGALRQSGAADAALARHGAAMRRAAVLFRQLRREGGEVDALVRFAPHDGDFEQAFARACERADSNTAADTLDTLVMMDHLRGDYSHTEQRLRAAQRLLPAARGEARARILGTAATCGWLSLPGLTGQQAAAAGLRAWRAIDHEGPEYHQLLLLHATELARTGHDARARRALRQAQSTIGSNARPYQRFALLAHASHVDTFAGRWAPAFEALRAALQVARESNLPRSACYALQVLPELALHTAGPALALRFACMAVHEARAQGMRRFLVNALVNQVHMATAGHDLAAAREIAAEALHLADELGVVVGMAFTFAGYALRIGQSAIGCELLGYTLAHTPTPRNRWEAVDLASLHALRSEAETTLGADETRILLHRGAAADARRVFGLAAQLQ